MTGSTVDDEKKARHRAACKKYVAANKEKLRMKDKMRYASRKARMLATKKQAYRQKHKEALQAKNKAWSVANREFKSAYKRARRARKKAIAAGKVPLPLPKAADFRAAQATSNQVVSAMSTAPAYFAAELLDKDDQLDDVPHPLAATTKKVVMISFTNEHPSACASVGQSRSATSAPCFIPTHPPRC
ncbi:hypothetical protein SDRG_03936 [Saprolegnia diclina VS20]|uniref:Uncharacterized protein n=1 Tax=Saprolegnia diclina (strain VS20) TaxID=1156394 RepID=T0S268_SAPDV|nr:hypothetical protein SDRG_03936 [Saprolegnia diclina VS20]EQC38983.1 hypothetical protein SDRG_03936 [Saprolegnia diclina VS20]|eukprot:XP_008607807.1 hypothetical protein SDRG_03936 [Saprolegnia diclina VS20]